MRQLCQSASVQSPRTAWLLPASRWRRWPACACSRMAAMPSMPRLPQLRCLELWSRCPSGLAATHSACSIRLKKGRSKRSMRAADRRTLRVSNSTARADSKRYLREGFIPSRCRARFTVGRHSRAVMAPAALPICCSLPLMPGIVGRDGKPYAAVGLKGGHVQPQVQAQIISNLIDFKMTVQEAISAPRFNHTDGVKDRPCAPK